MEERQLLSHRRRFQTPVRRPMRQGKACRWAFSPVPPQARVKFPVGVLRSRQREMAPSQPSGFAPDAGPTVQRFDALHARKISGWDEARSPKGVATVIILADGNSRPPGQHTASLRAIRQRGRKWHREVPQWAGYES